MTTEAAADAAEWLTDDLFYGGALRLLQPKRGHRFGGDAALLVAAARSRLAPGDRIVDLGAGVGAVGLALVMLGAGRALLVEIDPALSALSVRNAARNGLGERVQALAGDVSEAGRDPESGAGAAQLVVMNPPFDDASRFRASPDAAKARAHVDGGSVAPDWIAAAGRLLEPGGALVLIHRPEASPELLAALEVGFGDVRLLAVHPRVGSPAARVLIAARKGGFGPPGEKPPLAMHGPDGRFTPEADAAQRGRAALDLS
ncbi:methyltransferase [Methylopila sp. M107]|uniref:tRNA1(Val) (adenine(37)-N6)-methyltransferase n=1 Tax=Methylopila sp. M107 TaxID=1101190 RepID=UPI00036751A9|nr:methyltransferase [Methylopila sp. M107]